MSRRDARPARRHEWAWILVRLLLTAVIISGAYAGLAYYLGTHVPSRTVVAGVDVGGMTRAGARELLAHALGRKASTPVRITVGDRQVSIDPRTSGLRFDLDATLRGQTGVAFEPRVVWNRFTAARDLPLRIRVDAARLRAAVARATRGEVTAARTGSVRFDSGRVLLTGSVVGHTVDVRRTAAVLAARWPTRTAFDAVRTSTPPAVSTSQLRQVAAGFGKQAMAGPVQVVVGHTRVSLTTDQLSTVLSVRVRGHRLVPAGDGAALSRLVAAHAPRLGRAPVDAVVRIIGGEPVVVGGRPGRGLQPRALAAGVLRAVSTPSRTMHATLHSVAPATTTPQVRSWGIRDRLARYALTLPSGAPNAATRANADTAAARIDGTVVAPGHTFSVWRSLGEPTAARGYVPASILANGRLGTGVGGGISWTATALYNAAYLAGANIVTHTPHTALLPGYPAGRDATVSYPQIDLRWKNDTGHPVLIQADAGAAKVAVALWGTRYAEVSVSAGPRTQVVAPRRFQNSAPGCVPQQGVDGFTITVTRVLRLVDGPTKYQPFLTSYVPVDAVVCTHRAHPRG